MKVTIVAHHVGSIGGMERQLAALIQGLLDRRHEVTLVARRSSLPARAGYTFVHVRGPAKPFASMFSWFALAATVQLARLPKSDVLHVTGALVFARADVATVHFHNGSARLMHKLTRGDEPRRLYRLNRRVSLWLGSAVERWAYRPSHIRQLVAVSQGIRHDVVAVLPRLADCIEVIPNAVDAGVFHPDRAGRDAMRETLGLARTNLAALFVGSDFSHKGLAVAIRALADAPDWRLVVVGDGNEQAFTDEAVRAGVASRVQFVGPQRDPSPYYQAADAFVLPSAYEAFPMVALEAAACGLPLLATRLHGVEELLVDGRNGFVLERTPAAFSAALRQLSLTGLRAAMSRAALESAIPYTWDSVISAYEAVYERCRR